MFFFFFYLTGVLDPGVAVSLVSTAVQVVEPVALISTPTIEILPRRQCALLHSNWLKFI